MRTHHDNRSRPENMAPLLLTLTLGVALAQPAQAPDLKFSPVPGATLSDQSWKAEFEYPETATRAAFDFHDNALRTQGWQRTSLKTDGDDDDQEYDATYRRDGARVKLDVESDDDTAEIELELTGPLGQTVSLRNPPNLKLGYLGGKSVRDQSWTLETRYNGTSTAAVYQHYDASLTGQGGQRVSFDKDDREYDVDYTVSGQKINLEVERSGDGVKAKLEYEPSDTETDTDSD